MRHLSRIHKMSAAPPITSLVLTTVMASCGKPVDKNIQKTFAAPEDAGAAFLEAAKSGDAGTLVAIFGPDAKSALFSGDDLKDKRSLQDFVAGYIQMHRWREIKAGGQMLYIGADNYLFPIPLGQNPSGEVVLRHRGRQGRNSCAKDRQ
jgi:hypothetical protein